MSGWCRGGNEDGFSLIELVIMVAIIGILAATAVPAYSTFLNKARLLSAEISLTNALKAFIFEKEYGPPTGMLADLVVEGYLDAIPNDPWTDSAEGPKTGAEEAADWYYENDGAQLYLYAKSHPGRLYVLASYGLPPLTPVTTPSLPATVADARAQVKQLKADAKTAGKQLEADAKAAAKQLAADAKAAAKGESKSVAKQLKADAKAEGKQLRADAKTAGKQLEADAKAAGKQLIRDTKAALKK